MGLSKIKQVNPEEIRSGKKHYTIETPPRPFTGSGVVFDFLPEYQTRMQINILQ
jgi:hypothetical protein